jgi:hypothetical protein
MGLPPQNFIDPGLRLDALSTVTRLQLLQAIGQATPTDNIGFIVAFPGNSGANFPQISNNPEFARFIWADTDTDPPILKIWDQTDGDSYNAWKSISVGPASIVDSNLAENSVTLLDADGVTWKILIRPASLGPDPGKLNHLVKVDGNGSKIITDSIQNILTVGSVPQNSIAPGAANQFLRMVGGVWEAVNVEFASELANSSVSIGKLSPGGATANFVLRVNSAATAMEAVSNNDSVSNLLAANSVALNKLAPSGAIAGSVPRWNGASWAAAEPSVEFSGGFAINSGVDSSNNLTVLSHIFSHGLGKMPKLIRLVCKYTGSSEAGYVLNEEVDAMSFLLRNSANDINDKLYGGAPAFSISANETSIFVTLDDLINAVDGSLVVRQKSIGSKFTVTKANWLPRIYAWA